MRSGRARRPNCCQLRLRALEALGGVLALNRAHPSSASPVGSSFVENPLQRPLGFAPPRIALLVMPAAIASAPASGCRTPRQVAAVKGSCQGLPPGDDFSTTIKAAALGRRGVAAAD